LSSAYARHSSIPLAEKTLCSTRDISCNARGRTLCCSQNHIGFDLVIFVVTRGGRTAVRPYEHRFCAYRSTCSKPQFTQAPRTKGTLGHVYALSQAWRSLGQHLTSTFATFFTALVSFFAALLVGLGAVEPRPGGGLFGGGARGRCFPQTRCQHPSHPCSDQGVARGHGS